MQKIPAYLNDMILIESELRAAAQAQRGSDCHDRIPEIRPWIDSLIDTAGRHLAILDDAHTRSGGNTSAHRRGMGKVIGWAAGLSDRARLEHRASRGVRDLTVGLHLASTSYEMLTIIAAACGEADVAEQAGMHLSECVDLIGEGESLALQAVLQELRSDAIEIDEKTLDRCLTSIEKAWEPRSIIDAPLEEGVKGEGDPAADRRYRMRASAFARSGKAATAASEARQALEEGALRGAESRAASMGGGAA